MTTTHYYDATVDGWQRIMAVHSEHLAEALPPVERTEIPAYELPPGFANWHLYEAGAWGDDGWYEVFSVDGS